MNRLLTALLLLAPFAVQAADHTATHRATVTATDAAHYSFANLVGEVHVTAHDGADIVIEATVTAESAALAEQVGIARDGNELWMDYPVDEHRRYRHSERGSSTTTTYRGTRVEVADRGLRVAAVVHIALPRGTHMEVYLAAGAVNADGADGTLVLRTGSGRVEARNTRGALELRSGSGTVAVSGHDGPAELHTGSGRVRAEGVNGNLTARTGSGSVGVAGVRGDVAVRTGSGSVDVSGIAGATSVEIATGSGSVDIRGDLAGVTSMAVRTGSGSVDIDATGVPDVQLDARAGSGSVRVEVNGSRLPETGRNRVEAALGDGSGEATIRTGSGSIRINLR